MGEINLSTREKDALKGIDRSELDRAISRAIDTGAVAELHRLLLAECGIFVSSKLNALESAIWKYRDAKSSRKIEETHQAALRAGSDLYSAFAAMVDRMEAEERFDEFFHVDDTYLHPYRFRPDMSVTVSFRWRKFVMDAWTHGTITFTHVFKPKPTYAVSAPRRKPSAAKQAAALQEEMGQEWEHLRCTALYTVRDFFQDGGDGSTIPETFKVVTDSQGHLNNFSARWWLEKRSNGG